MNDGPINDGGHAFPIPINPGETWNSEKHGNPNGMTIRDYFAAHEIISFDELGYSDKAALAGESPEREVSETDEQFIRRYVRWDAEWRSALKFIRADAMLKAREVKP